MPSLSLNALIFDMDGTLTEPTLDFTRMRQEIGLPDDGDIAHHIGQLTREEQRRAWAVIEQHEDEAMRTQRPQRGCLQLLRRCREAGFKLGLVTRNTQRSVDYFCSAHGLTFDGVITREFPFMKPHPGPIRHLLETWSVAPQATLTIGDYLHDIDCGRAAGTRTCFYQNDGKPFFGQDADFVVASMRELEAVIFGTCDETGSAAPGMQPGRPSGRGES